MPINEDSPESETSLEFPETGVSPLRGLAIETHEVYLELIHAGFPVMVASQIVGQMLYHDMSSRSPYSGEDDEYMDFAEDDDENDEYT